MPPTCHQAFQPSWQETAALKLFASQRQTRVEFEMLSEITEFYYRLCWEDNIAELLAANIFAAAAPIEKSQKPCSGNRRQRLGWQANRTESNKTGFEY